MLFCNCGCTIDAAISAKGVKTNCRNSILGCGSCKCFCEITSFLNSRISKSMGRAWYPSLGLRSLPNLFSMLKRASKTSNAVYFVSILIQAFKNASLSKPQAGVSYTLETERMVPILESIQSTASWS